jgi:hypothetical protein
MYDALVSINVPENKAKAVIDAMEREMMDKLATKSDIQLVRQEMSSMKDSLSKDIQSLDFKVKADLAELKHSMTMRLGAMILGTAALSAALRQIF